MLRDPDLNRCFECDRRLRVGQHMHCSDECRDKDHRRIDRQRWESILAGRTATPVISLA